MKYRAMLCTPCPEARTKSTHLLRSFNFLKEWTLSSLSVIWFSSETILFNCYMQCEKPHRLWHVAIIFNSLSPQKQLGGFRIVFPSVSLKFDGAFNDLPRNASDLVATKFLSSFPLLLPHKRKGKKTTFSPFS